MKTVLVLVRPYDVAAAARVDVRIADGASADAYGVGGVQWEPAISVRPKQSIELFSLALDGSVQPGKLEITLLPRNLKLVPRAELLYWDGAPIVVHCDGVLEGPTAVADFVGNVSSVNYDRDAETLALTAEVTMSLIDKPILTLAFDGSGGLGGDADKRGTLYPAGFGIVPNIEPVWFDLTRNIGMIDGYGNLLSVEFLGEGRSSFGPAIADYANYAALAAAIDGHAVPPGRWATCIAQGLIGLGAPPTGTITVDATFGFARSGSWIQRILTTHAAIDVARIDTASLAALDAAVNRPTHYWLATQRTVKDLLQAICRACNATPLLTFQNVITVTRAIGGPPAATLDRAGGGAPRVLNWRTANPPQPFYKLVARTARPALVLSFDQINYVDTIVDRGVYNAATTYRAGNLVWLADNSQWLYINATPAAGNSPTAIVPPATANDYWQRTKAPTSAGDIKYSSGASLDSKEPAGPGATQNLTPRVTVPPTSPGLPGTIVTYDPPTGGPSIVYIADPAGVFHVAANNVTEGQDIGVENGADVTKNNQNAMGDVADITLEYDYQGNLLTSLPSTARTFTRLYGTNDVSPNTAYSVSGTGFTYSLNNTAGDAQRGTFTLTAFTGGDGTTITMAEAYAGVTLYKQITVHKSYGSAPTPGGGGGGGAPGAAATTTGPFTAPAKSASAVVMATLPGVTIGSSGQCKLSASISYSQTDSSTYSNDSQDFDQSTAIDYQWQRSVGGGAWTNVSASGGSGTGTGAVKGFRPVAPKGSINSPGQITSAVTDTGLTSGGSVAYRLLGLSDTMSQSGTAGGTGAASLGTQGLSGNMGATPQ